MHDEDDIHAVRSCLAGDTNAFAILVERHRHAVYNLAYRMSGNATTAEDLAQEAFVRAFTRLHQYKPQFTFRNWVLGICANLARGRYRGWRRRQALERAYGQQELLRLETQPPTATDSASADRVTRALQSLPPALRAPVVLRYMEDLSVKDVADALGIRLSAAKMRLARGRQQLAAFLDAHPPDLEVDA